MLLITTSFTFWEHIRNQIIKLVYMSYVTYWLSSRWTFSYKWLFNFLLYNYFKLLLISFWNIKTAINNTAVCCLLVSYILLYHFFYIFSFRRRYIYSYSLLLYTKQCCCYACCKKKEIKRKKIKIGRWFLGSTTTAVACLPALQFRIRHKYLHWNSISYFFLFFHFYKRTFFNIFLYSFLCYCMKNCIWSKGLASSLHLRCCFFSLL